MSEARLLRQRPPLESHAYTPGVVFEGSCEGHIEDLCHHMFLVRGHACMCVGAYVLTC